MYDDKAADLDPHDDHHVLSFDAAVLSVSQELDRVKEVPEEEHCAEARDFSKNGNARVLRF